MTDDLWRFDHFRDESPERARVLSAAPTWPELIDLTCDALRASLAAGHTRFGFDESSVATSDLRAIIQFLVTHDLFDWFFNANTGYRGQFRRGWANGLAENAKLVAQLKEVIAEHKPGLILARRLDHQFSDIGPMNASSMDLLASLEPTLSKVWCCERVIGFDGAVASQFVSRTGPKLLLPDGSEWSSLFAEGEGAWLDLKGAFRNGDGKLYQLKDSVARAKNLENSGTA